MIGEVLELNNRLGEALGDGDDKFINEVVVFLARNPRVRVAEIKRVVEQLLVVRADVQGDGQGGAGMDTRAGGLKRKFAHGDAHPAGP